MEVVDANALSERYLIQCLFDWGEIERIENGEENSGEITNFIGVYLHVMTKVSLLLYHARPAKFFSFLFLRARWAKRSPHVTSLTCAKWKIPNTMSVLLTLFWIENSR